MTVTVGRLLGMVTLVMVGPMRSEGMQRAGAAV
jgi:hypothetical protein